MIKANKNNRQCSKDWNRITIFTIIYHTVHQITGSYICHQNNSYCQKSLAITERAEEGKAKGTHKWNNVGYLEK